jgi:hypothetical protein
LPFGLVGVAISAAAHAVISILLFLYEFAVSFMDAETADPQRDAPETTKQDAQDKAKETSDVQPAVEASNAPLLSWNAVVRALADIEAKPAAAIAAVAVVLVLSLFGRVGSLVVGLLGGLLIHAAIERKRDAVQYRTTGRDLAFAPDSESAVVHAQEVIPPMSCIICLH